MELTLRIFLQIITAIIAFIIVYLDYKWYDKRTKEFKIGRNVLILLTIPFIVGNIWLAVSDYENDLNQKLTYERNQDSIRTYYENQIKGIEETKDLANSIQGKTDSIISKVGISADSMLHVLKTKFDNTGNLIEKLGNESKMASKKIQLSIDQTEKYSKSINDKLEYDLAFLRVEYSLSLDDLKHYSSTEIFNQFLSTYTYALVFRNNSIMYERLDPKFVREADYGALSWENGNTYFENSYNTRDIGYASLIVIYRFSLLSGVNIQQVLKNLNGLGLDLFDKNVSSNQYKSNRYNMEYQNIIEKIKPLKCYLFFKNDKTATQFDFRALMPITGDGISLGRHYYFEKKN